MKKVYDLVLILFGVPSLVWDKFDGIKTYLGSTILILNGITGLLVEVRNAESIGSIVLILRDLCVDPNLAMIGAGLIGLGLRHSISKSPQAL